MMPLYEAAVAANTVYFLLRGGIAQLVERLLCKQEAVGSSPTTSTRCHTSCFFQDPFRKSQIIAKP